MRRGGQNRARTRFAPPDRFAVAGSKEARARSRNSVGVSGTLFAHPSAKRARQGSRRRPDTLEARAVGRPLAAQHRFGAAQTELDGEGRNRLRQEVRSPPARTPIPVEDMRARRRSGKSTGVVDSRRRKPPGKIAAVGVGQADVDHEQVGAGVFSTRRPRVARCDRIGRRRPTHTRPLGNAAKLVGRPRTTRIDLPQRVGSSFFTQDSHRAGSRRGDLANADGEAAAADGDRGPATAARNPRPAPTSLSRKCANHTSTGTGRWSWGCVREVYGVVMCEYSEDACTERLARPGRRSLLVAAQQSCPHIAPVSGDARDLMFAPSLLQTNAARLRRQRRRYVERADIFTVHGRGLLVRYILTPACAPFPGIFGNSFPCVSATFTRSPPINLRRWQRRTEEENNR